MSQEQEPRPKKAAKAVWNEAETDALITYLHSQRSKIGDGGNFRSQVYTEAATAIAPHRTLGPTKIASHCKNKWQSLKNLYHVIENYRLKTSGTHWDHQIGAGIEGKAASDVWDAYMEKKANQVMRPFRNIGWHSHVLMQDILPSGSGARGRAAYHPSRATAPATTDGSSDRDSAAPMVPNIGTGSLEDTHMADAHIEQELDWRHVLHDGRRPTSGSSDLAPIPPSTRTSSIGKRAHSDITGMHSQSIIAPSSTFTSISQRESSSKKPKISSHSVAHINYHSEVNESGGRGIKPTNAVAMIGMQGALNRLTDSLVKQVAVTDESRSTEQRGQAIRMLMEQDDDLSLEDRVSLMNVFLRNAAVTSSYIDATDPTLRRAFVVSIIQQYAAT
ncbi:uncharacterized protein HD556DRAFT_1529526 [Suillus plorans]|uniref:Myb/SANT-like DNA-binding domain-containing protein n=1 Tax=Suillus plorans TaxID=116603 RepID=A0A9P7AHI1_9AGAM|nr:uncharacterized protein HD556DRAFT_1529526 [Suillus plorans]KAG1789465.1 hypothetical protein HD556DRAFT_1529526 [Suillus plorans]